MVFSLQKEEEKSLLLCLALYFVSRKTSSYGVIQYYYNPSARTQTLFCCFLKHLGGIWEAFGGSLGALWGNLWELGQPWGLQGHLRQEMLQIHRALQQKQKKYNFA